MNENLNGFDNEYAFVLAFNGKRFNELNPLCQKFLEEMYVVIPDDAIIKAWKNQRYKM